MRPVTGSLPCSDNVRQAIDALYLEFAAPLPRFIHGCPCCIETRRVDVLLATPLHEIPAMTLWRYVSGAFLTVGSEQDFRYLLPRILEVSACEPHEANDPEIVLGKLALANWTSWPEEERRAIERFIDAWFDQALAQDLAEADGWSVGQEAESVLCGAARAGLSIDRFLAKLREPSAAPVLGDLKARHPRALSAFWKEAPDGLRALSEMLGAGPGFGV